jgi:SAM-dependent methyltransferase
VSTLASAAPALAPASAAGDPAAAAREAARMAQEQRRLEAERWVAALPSRTTFRPRSAAAPFPRLVQYRTGASTPEYWEKLWVANPSFRMRGYKLPAWYQDVFARRLPSDGIIVEAGCGNGNLVRMLINHDPMRWGGGITSGEPGRAFAGARVEGLDFAERAVAESRRIHPEGCYRVGDVRALPYADGQIAAYLSMGVVEHFDEPTRAIILREAARALRPGGVAIITVPYFSPARRVRAMLGGFPRESAGVDGLEFYQFFFTAREIRRQVEAAGFRIVEVNSYDARKGFTDVLGGHRLLSRLEKLGPAAARFIEQPPRPLRRCFAHMVMMVAVKP